MHEIPDTNLPRDFDPGHLSEIEARELKDRLTYEIQAIQQQLGATHDREASAHWRNRALCAKRVKEHHLRLLKTHLRKLAATSDYELLKDAYDLLRSFANEEYDADELALIAKIGDRLYPDKTNAAP